MSNGKMDFVLMWKWNAYDVLVWAFSHTIPWSIEKWVWLCASMRIWELQLTDKTTTTNSKWISKAVNCLFRDSPRIITVSTHSTSVIRSSKTLRIKKKSATLLKLISVQTFRIYSIKIAYRLVFAMLYLCFVWFSNWKRQTKRSRVQTSSEKIRAIFASTMCSNHISCDLLAYTMSRIKWIKTIFFCVFFSRINSIDRYLNWLNEGRMKRIEREERKNSGERVLNFLFDFDRYKTRKPIHRIHYTRS